MLGTVRCRGRVLGPFDSRDGSAEDMELRWEREIQIRDACDNSVALISTRSALANGGGSGYSQRRLELRELERGACGTVPMRCGASEGRTSLDLPLGNEGQCVIDTVKPKECVELWYFVPVTIHVLTCLILYCDRHLFIY